MKLDEIWLSGTTNGSGALTVNGTTAVVGRLYAIRWIDGTLSNGAGAVISVQGHEASETLLTLANPACDNDATFYPRALVHNATGTALTGTAGGDRALPLMVGTPRLVVSSGGATKTCGCILFYFEE